MVAVLLRQEPGEVEPRDRLDRRADAAPLADAGIVAAVSAYPGSPRSQSGRVITSAQRGRSEP